MLKIKKAKRAAPLFNKFDRVFTENSRLSREGECCAYKLDLVSPDGREVYELTVYDDPEWTFGLFAPGVKAGRGSFVDWDGKFTQHGSITEADTARILSTFTPARRA